ncbi:uncharacterized protein C9orf117 homolog [Stegastes partitus]|uniref:Uncharacterized protein C9orf117 homolog n=1 Tax=Stegastes partitus TaxID=144197 RepID=A0A9Y4KJ20_9TELE|nr:PREDICTED: uncharacterized protein C9orf117 homolog [Stegastes partitus]
MDNEWESLLADVERKLVTLTLPELGCAMHRASAHCQLKCDQLTKQNKKLVQQISAVREDKKDICEYLQHASAALDREVAELTEQLEVQRQTDKQSLQDLELLLKVKLEQQQQQMSQYQSDIQSAQKQLDAKEKERAAARLEWLEAQELMRKKPSSQPKERAGKKLKAERSEVQEKYESLLLENYTLWKESESAEKRIEVLQCETDRKKKNLQEVTSRVGSLQQEVDRWTKKCKQLQSQKEKNSSLHQRVLDEEQTLRRERASASETARQRAAEIEEVKVQLKEAKASRRQVEKDVKQAVAILRPMVADPDKVPDAQQRLQKLKKILQSPGSVVSNSAKEVGGGQELQEPEPERSDIRT